MSLYHDAVSILTNPPSTGGSFKSRIYTARNLRSPPAQIYALIVESAKYDLLLKEVIERAELLKLETKITPHLALFLVHDHLLSKRGIAAPAKHPLRQAIERHRSRLKGEFIKARVRRGCASIDGLKSVVVREKKALTGGNDGEGVVVYPRWVRVNTLRTSLAKQLEATFAGYQQVDSLAALIQDDGGDDEDQKRMFIDPHIPDLVAVPPGVEFTTSAAYKDGAIILQDKASCFPAYLLAGEGEWEESGDLVDGCAAPGNKTTHLAALTGKARSKRKHKIISMDASHPRSKTLQKMVTAAGANDIVTVLAGQDFLAINPETDTRFANVSGLLLDPSCSGSGIIGRDDQPTVVLPTRPTSNNNRQQGKKRKREPGTNTNIDTSTNKQATSPAPTEENDTLPSRTTDKTRLAKLSSLQSRIVEHALSFPAATRVTYSTCSTHVTENEGVVQRVLGSDVARARGWRVLRRGEQPVGLRAWTGRGIRRECSPAAAGEGEEEKVDLTDEELDGCLRCWPGDEEGVGGFFVVGFVRGAENVANGQGQDQAAESQDEDDDPWEGFSD